MDFVPKRGPRGGSRVRLVSLPLFFVGLALAAGTGCDSCNENALETQSATVVEGLTPEQAARVVAKVGDREITLGDYAATLERMDHFDRLRYQTKERRRELLEEMINVELMAAEAKRRGLDDDPTVRSTVRQILREAMLAEARRGLRAPVDIPAEEVRAYYDAHIDDYREPERRRVSAIILDSKEKAEEAIEKAKEAETAEAWGALVEELTPSEPSAFGKPPLDLVGDLGIVGPPDDEKGSNPRVPSPVQAAIFKLSEVGDVHPVPIEHEGKFFVVRLSGKTPGHTRSVEEADRSIRVAILQAKMEENEAALLETLRKEIEVSIDDAALEKLPPPSPLDRLGPGPKEP